MKKLSYREPDNFFPKEIRDKYFGKKKAKGTSTTKKTSTAKKPGAKKK